MKYLIVLILILVCQMLYAEVDVISLSGQNWHVMIDAPKLDQKREHVGGAVVGNIFMASGGRFNVSLSADSLNRVHGGNKDCFDFYWSQASRDPMIVQNSIKVSSNDKFYRVEYIIEGEFGGKLHRHKGVNYYFVVDGKWVDLHISIFEYTDHDEPVIVAFDKTLAYGKKT